MCGDDQAKFARSQTTQTTYSWCKRDVAAKGSDIDAMTAVGFITVYDTFHSSSATHRREREDDGRPQPGDSDMTYGEVKRENVASNSF